MRRSPILLLLIFASVLQSTRAQVTDVFFIPELNEVKLMGYTGSKMNGCINNGIMKTDEDYLVAPFRQRKEDRFWQSEFWGKWITSAEDAYRYNKNPKLLAQLKKAVDGLIATQTEDGYIGNYAPDKRLQQWDIWGMKYCLLGLEGYYEITGDQKALQAASRLANYAIQKIDAGPEPINKLGNHRGMAASSILEPIVKLYRVTQSANYYKFANYIINSWANPEGPDLINKALQNIPVGERFPIPQQWFGPLNGRKAYEMMSCYEGLLEWYRITGHPQYLEAVKKTAENIRQTEIFITGSGTHMENWYGGAALQATPARHPQETCVSATWMKLCLQLLRSTGEAKWANEIEKTFYNALLGAMKPDGSTWNKYTEIMGVKNLGENQCGMNINCCVASGPRGMMVLAKEAFMTTANGVVVNYYGPAIATISINKKTQVNLNLNTDFPKSNEINMSVNPAKESQFDILLRLPDWSSKTSIAVNGHAVETPTKNGYAIIKRRWKKGDLIKVDFEMDVREIKLKNEPAKYALVYGPIVLASDNRYQASPMYRFYTPMLKNGRIPFEISAVPKNPDVYLEMKLPFLREATGGADIPETLVLTDFASAGNTWDERSAYLVWFQRPLDFRLDK